MLQTTLLSVQDVVTSTMASSLLGTGEFLGQQGYHVEALAYMQKALALRPALTRAGDGVAINALRRGIVLQTEGKLPEAEAMLRKALAVRKNFPAASATLAGLLVAKAQASQPAEAEAALREALALYPELAEAKALLDGILAAKSGEVDSSLAAAEAKLRGDLASNLSEPQIVHNLGVVLYQQAVNLLAVTRYAEAESILRGVVALRPDFVEAIQGLALTLYQGAVPMFNSKRFAEAEAALWEALCLNPGFAQAAQFIDLCARHPARSVINVTEPHYADAALALRNSLLVKDVVGPRYIRKGQDGDGGYVMVDYGLKNTAVYSLGVGGDVSFDLDLAGQGCQIYQYDHTVEGLPVEHPNFHWSKIGITATPGTDEVFRTVDELIKLNGHAKRKDLILKVDIEGHEWAMFAEMSDETLCQFSQIVGEFHGLTGIIDPVLREKVLAAFSKLNKHFQLVHLHATNYGTLSIIGGVTVYNDFELTYLRKAGNKFADTKRVFPTPLDRPCHTKVAEYIVGQHGR